MDDITFLSKLQNMCDNMDSCDTCPLGKLHQEGKLQTCLHICNEHIKEYVDTVVEYTSRLTRQSLFLDMYPAAKMEDGVLDVCPHIIDSSYSYQMSDCPSCKSRYGLHQIL